MTRLFVYGTLMKGYGNHVLLGRSSFLGVERTERGFTLYARAIPFLVRTASRGTVQGELYEVDASTLRVIDALEGHPLFYRREPIRLINGEGAEAYLLPHAPADAEEVETGSYRTYRGPTALSLR